jgi:glycerophosphoryl diester phosphodiesterase
VGHHLLLNIELKTKSLGDDGLAGAVVRVVEANGLVDRVIVSSFNPLALWRVKQLNALVDIGLLYAPHLPFFLRHPWLRLLLRPNALHPHHTMVDGEYMRWAGRNGYRIHAWVVEDADEVQRLTEWGVDSIITSQPDLLRKVISSGRK